VIEKKRPVLFLQVGKMDLKHTHKLNLSYHLVKPWLGVAWVVGMGLLPCPECGVPMIIHFWPIAAVLALRNLLREKKKKNSSLDELNAYMGELSANPEINHETGGNQ